KLHDKITEFVPQRHRQRTAGRHRHPPRHRLRETRMTTTADPPAPPTAALRRLPSLDTPAVKATLLIALTLLLLIPLYLGDDVNRDRAAHQEEARAEYQRSWGPSQSVIGPILSIPYTTGVDGVRHYLNIAPRRMAVDSDLQPEVRRRGLFRAVVYHAKV